jgi:hypothetical protein
MPFILGTTPTASAGRPAAAGFPWHRGGVSPARSRQGSGPQTHRGVLAPAAVEVTPFPDADPPFRIRGVSETRQRSTSSARDAGRRAPAFASSASTRVSVAAAPAPDDPQQRRGDVCVLLLRPAEAGVSSPSDVAPAVRPLRTAAMSCGGRTHSSRLRQRCLLRRPGFPSAATYPGGRSVSLDVPSRRA